MRLQRSLATKLMSGCPRLKELARPASAWHNRAPAELRGAPASARSGSRLRPGNVALRRPTFA
eukprot:141024-Alexandrium_andersonii.AAC.1